jgi:hypothetical protein
MNLKESPTANGLIHLIKMDEILKGEITRALFC